MARVLLSLSHPRLDSSSIFQHRLHIRAQHLRWGGLLGCRVLKVQFSKRRTTGIDCAVQEQILLARRLICIIPSMIGNGPISMFGDRPKTVSESSVSSAKLSELFAPHRAPRPELIEFLSSASPCLRNSPLVASPTRRVAWKVTVRYEKLG